MNKKLNIALMGNPNSGKSTLFNSITGLNQKVANFAGVTVEKKSGKRIFNSTDITVIDLPGCYSLFPSSIDEKIAVDIVSNKSNKNYPDKIIVVIDACNLKKHLFLVTQLIDLEIPIIIALNMLDLAKQQNILLDTTKIEKKLGVPVVEINAKKNKGITELLQKTIDTNVNKNHTCFTKSDYDITYNKLVKCLNDSSNNLNINSSRAKATETVRRQKFISSVLDSFYKNKPTNIYSFSDKIDNILTHKVWGYVIFGIIMFAVFQSIYSLAEYPMQWIESIFQITSNYLQNILPENSFSNLLINGVLAGLEGVVIFIPQIAFLFAFISLLEDTGYMARVSFIMDKLMRRFGLNGKSIVPLISGIACAIPAIMSARTIKSDKERLITILVTPFMSCAARLPVYALIISLIIPQSAKLWIFNVQGFALFFLYFLGLFAALSTAFILKLLLKTPSKSLFLMELPSYKIPNWKSISLTIYEKSKSFVLDAGKIIIAISIILWALSSYGPKEKMNSIENSYTQKINANQDKQESLLSEMNSKKLEASYAGIIGKSVEPIIKPLGFDWKMGIALITSFAAREVFVGTMATIYSVPDSNNNQTLRQKMASQTTPSGEKQYSLAVGFSLMIFYAFAMQCMSTLAIVYQETKSWTWPIAQFLFMGTVAYLASFITYSILS